MIINHSTYVKILHSRKVDKNNMPIGPIRRFYWMDISPRMGGPYTHYHPFNDTYRPVVMLILRSV